MLAADDERDFDYSAVTVAWIEDGFVPDHFSLGVENGRATQPWAWAAGHDTWRPCPPTAQVMARTVIGGPAGRMGLRSRAVSCALSVAAVSVGSLAIPIKPQASV